MRAPATLLLEPAAEDWARFQDELDGIVLGTRRKEVIDVKTGPGKAESIDNLKRVS